jgi:hypothetical protein
LKQILLINLISIFILSITFAKEVQNYKINFNLDNILLKGRDIKESSNFIVKNNIKFNFVKYNEKNSFLEITLRTLDNNNQYFSQANIIQLISKKRIEFMENLIPEKLTDIHTFFDYSEKRNFYYRTFNNKKFEKEQCLIFSSGVRKNKDNLYNQVVNGVGCSTEIKLSHKNVGKILSLIQIKKDN